MWKVLMLFVIFSEAYSGKVTNLVDSSKITLYSLTEKKTEFKPKDVGFSDKKDASAVAATLNRAVTHQTIVGFGATFTDATTINLNKASADVRSQILKLLFSKDGLGFNLCRVPIGSTEYSTRPYSLDDHNGDTNLKQFALQQDDLDRVRTYLYIFPRYYISNYTFLKYIN